MKIALITLSPHYNIGGVEKYNWHLIEILKKFNHDVVEICTQADNGTIARSKLINSIYIKKLFKKQNFISEIFEVLRTKIILKRILKKLIKQNFDLFIFSSPYVFKNKKILKKSVFVQHFPLTKYLSIGIKLFFGNPLKNHKNFVLFTKDDELWLRNIRTNCANIVNVPLFGFEEKTLKNMKYKDPSQNNRISYIGRYDNKHKNLEFMKEVADNLKYPIHLYGKGDFISKSNYIFIHDWIDESEVLEVINNSKLVICTSNYEGFPFMISQAISLGKPFISRNCCLSMKFLSNNKMNGEIVEMNKTPKEYANILKNILSNYNFNYLKILDFYNKNMSYENFSNNWIKIINKFKKS